MRTLVAFLLCASSNALVVSRPMKLRQVLPAAGLAAVAVPAAANAAAALPTVAQAAAPTVANAAALLISNNDLLQSNGLQLFRDPTDIYYAFLAVVGLGYVAKNAFNGLIENAKEYDARGATANKLLADTKKRERSAARDKVRKNDVAYERLQREAKDREQKRKGWKVFDPD